MIAWLPGDTYIYGCCEHQRLFISSFTLLNLFIYIGTYYLGLRDNGSEAFLTNEKN